MNPDEWHKDALCASVGGDWWFPEIGESSSEAKRICRQCPVQITCLETALSRDERWGVWGGVGARTRLEMRRARRAA